MPSVEIRTGSRLHFGLFPSPHHPNGFGGVGMMIDKPGWRIVVSTSRSPTDVIVAPDADVHARIAVILETIRHRHEFPSIRIEVKESIPAHVGLGSGTQLAMAAAEAILELIGRRPAGWQELAELTGRAKRSCVGAAGYWNGGLIVDAGERARTAMRFDPPSLVVLAIRTAGAAGLHAGAEETAFAKWRALDAAERRAGVDVTAIYSAAVRKDFHEFGALVSEFNRTVGEAFRPLQGGRYASDQVVSAIDWLRSHGVSGAGQSSWGPTVFGFVRDRALAARLAPELLALDAVDNALSADPLVAGRNECRRNIPKLLVSVRNDDEVDHDVYRWIDVLDFKEPRNGPLGRPDPTGCDRRSNFFANLRHPLSVSVALGELSDWGESAPGLEAYADLLSLSRSSFAKVGFAGERGRDWAARFDLLRARVAELPIDDESTYTNAVLLPAAYADRENARAPSWREIFERILLPSGPRDRRLLVDTFDKSKRLFDYMPDDELRELFALCREHGVKLALAGSLRAADIEPMAEKFGMLPDVIAVRGAACKDGDRDGPIDSDRVVELHRAIRRALWKLPAD